MLLLSEMLPVQPHAILSVAVTVKDATEMLAEALSVPFVQLTERPVVHGVEHSSHQPAPSQSSTFTEGVPSAAMVAHPLAVTPTDAHSVFAATAYAEVDALMPESGARIPATPLPPAPVAFFHTPDWQDDQFNGQYAEQRKFPLTSYCSTLVDVSTVVLPAPQVAVTPRT